MNQNNRTIVIDWINSVKNLTERIENYKHSMESWEDVRDRTSAEHDSDDLKEHVDMAWSALHESVKDLCAPALHGGKSTSRKQRHTRKQNKQRKQRNNNRK